MDSGVFFGGSVVAAVVAGTIALMAPCCVSVMLPSFFAASFHNRRLLLAMTFLFSAGVATVILPIALGASALRRLLVEDHTTVYLLGGALMLALGLFTLLGGRLRLSMPGGRPAGRGPLGVYGLGVFSGVATACCAPVLAGVVALSGVAGSFGASLGLGVAYVFGMVAPLFALASVSGRWNWNESRLFRPRAFTYRLGPLRRTIGGTALASGALLAAMGVWALWTGVSGGMRSSRGWQADLQLRLEQVGHWVTRRLAWLPGWAAGITLAAVIVALGIAAARQVGWLTRREATPPDGAELIPTTFDEELYEHEY